MSSFTPYIIIVAAMLILLLLQLSPGVFTLFLHYASGKYSRSKSSRLSLFFILGAEAMSTCVFLTLYFLANLLFFTDYVVTSQILLYILAGISVTLAIFCFIFYYRRGKHSELFIPRKYAACLERTAHKVKSPSDTFVLGALSGNSELFLSVPLFLIIILESLHLNIVCIVAIITIVTTILPLLFIHFRFNSGQNLAHILKSRIQNKSFVRFSLGTLYLLIAILIFAVKAPL